MKSLFSETPTLNNAKPQLQIDLALNEFTPSQEKSLVHAGDPDQPMAVAQTGDRPGDVPPAPQMAGGLPNDIAPSTFTEEHDDRPLTRKPSVTFRGGGSGSTST